MMHKPLKAVRLRALLNHEFAKAQTARSGWRQPVVQACRREPRPALSCATPQLQPSTPAEHPSLRPLNHTSCRRSSAKSHGRRRHRRAARLRRDDHRGPRQGERPRRDDAAVLRRSGVAMSSSWTARSSSCLSMTQRRRTEHAAACADLRADQQAERRDHDDARSRRTTQRARSRCRPRCGARAPVSGRPARWRFDRTAADHERRRPRLSAHASEVRRGQGISRAAARALRATSSCRSSSEGMYLVTPAADGTKSSKRASMESVRILKRFVDRARGDRTLLSITLARRTESRDPPHARARGIEGARARARRDRPAARRRSEARPGEAARARRMSSKLRASATVLSGAVGCVLSARTLPRRSIGRISPSCATDATSLRLRSKICARVKPRAPPANGLTASTSSHSSARHGR